MKKLFITLLSLCMLFCACFAVACGGSNSSTDKNGSNNPSDTTPKESQGLEYTLINNETEYEVTSIGECLDINVVVPSTYNGLSVTSIGENAFGENHSGNTPPTIISITLPNSIKNIGKDAFLGCYSLRKVILSNGLKTIGDGAFNCCGLYRITIPSSVTSIGKGAFTQNSFLTSVTVGDGNTVYHSTGNCLIETATKTLMLGCKNSVIPTDGSVTSIGASAFSGCSSLRSIVIPDSVTSIGSAVFLDCGSLTSITYNGTMAEWNTISKHNYWDVEIENHTIHCTDGDISKA